jgi:hypothetical protein
MRRIPASFHIKLRTEASNEFRLAALRRKHSGQKKQITRLNRFHVRAERLGRRGELDPKFFQALFGACG